MSVNVSDDRCRLCGTRSLRLRVIESEVASQINFLFHLHISLTSEEEKLSKSVCRNCLSSVSSCWIFNEQVQKVQNELFASYFNESELLSDDPLNINNVVCSEQNVNCKRTVIKTREKGIKVRYKTRNSRAVEDDYSSDLVSATMIDVHREREPQTVLHMAKQSFDCRKCGKSFANKRYLKQHEPVHSEEKQFICDVCGKGFRQAPGLDYHTKKYHTEADQQFHCDQCGKMFPVKKNLEVHMITHASERPFVCDICQKTFKTQFSVDLHRTRHADSRKYICKICGKTYKILRDLQVHTKTHTTDRTHKCSFCEKAFKMKSHLISHERQHTGEQPYSCLVCQRKFTSVGNRLKHMRRIHKICLREKDRCDLKGAQVKDEINSELK